MKTLILSAAAILVPAIALAGSKSGFPGAPGVPEIDALSGLAAIAVVGATVALLRERAKR